MLDRSFPKKLQQGALLQLILLHTLYSQRGSDQLIFQGGTALRWIYGGQRASEDLDFVSSMPPSELRKLLNNAISLSVNSAWEPSKKNPVTPLPDACSGPLFRFQQRGAL
jgi:hypothetical protein